MPWPGWSASPFLFLVIFRAQHPRHFQHKCQEECHSLVLSLFTMGYVILWHRCLLTHSWRSWFLTSKLLFPLSSSAAITLLTSDSSSCTLLKLQLSVYLIANRLTWASRLGSSWLWTLCSIFHPLLNSSTSSLMSFSCFTQPVLFLKIRLPCEHCSLAISLVLFLVGEASALFKHNPWSYSKSWAD